jgi:hypothetical protein
MHAEHSAKNTISSFEKNSFGFGRLEHVFDHSNIS